MISPSKDLKLVLNFMYDAIRYRKYYTTNNTYISNGKMLSKITLIYHAVEKGLAFPHFRAGFGQSKIIELAELLKIYSEKFKIDFTNIELRSAVSALKNYKKVHADVAYKLPEDLTRTIDSVVANYSNIKNVDSIIDIIGKQDYSKLTFAELLNKRHSIRNFKPDDIPQELLINSIKSAQRAPSVCNRQASRVHIVRNKDIKAGALKIQGGTTGFTESIPILLIITFNLNFFYESERNQGYIDSGLFSMNLINGLLVNNIGSCPLHWGVSFRRDKKLRNVVDIPSNEEVVMLIGIGFIPDKLKVAASNRKETETIIKVHN